MVETMGLSWSWAVAMAFVLGMLVGSFCNVMGLRLLSDTDFVAERSECPLCHTGIAWYDNLPVLSYLWLGAKCRHCASPISLQYPVVELLTGCLFAATVGSFGLNWGTPFLLFFMANQVVMIITDWREKLIFHLNSFPLIPAGIAYNLLGLDAGLTSATHWAGLALGNSGFMVSGPLLSAVAGVVGIFLLFEGMILLSRWIFGTDGFGHGDTYLLMGFAAYLGWELALLALLAGFIIQSVIALPLLFVQWIRRRQWRLLGTLSASLLFALLPFFWLNPSVLTGPLGLGLSLGCMIVTIVCLILFMKEVRQQEQFTYMPLGPALIAGAVLALFKGKAVLATLFAGGL